MEKEFYNKNLSIIPMYEGIDGTKTEDRSMKSRLGFLPSSLWKPDITITKELKKVINDTAQTRPSLNASRSDRRHGVNGGKCSVFNPHLAQMVISAYCPLNAKIYDPFGGGGTRGYISTKMGHDYTGVEIREEEVNRINNQMKEWNINFKMELGDSSSFKTDKKFNFCFTCPPYYDLELYSNMNEDLSNAKTYNDYLLMLKDVLKNTYNLLQEESLAVFVIGNFRNKKGNLEHLNGDLIRLAKEVGFNLWDEIIWQGASNVALTRCGKFEVNRKCVRMHEYIIILKRNPNFVFSEQNEINSQQIKKDDNLMGKSSGDTKIESGSKNHLKDFQSDNQSADKLFANQKQDEVKKDE